MDIVQGIVPSVKTALNGIVEKRDIFEAFIISGPITGATLEEVEKSTMKLANDVIELIPAKVCTYPL